MHQALAALAPRRRCHRRQGNKPPCPHRARRRWCATRRPLWSGPLRSSLRSPSTLQRESPPRAGARVVSARPPLAAAGDVRAEGATGLPPPPAPLRSASGWTQEFLGLTGLTQRLVLAKVGNGRDVDDVRQQLAQSFGVAGEDLADDQ